MNESKNRYLNPVFIKNQTGTYGITILEQDFLTNATIKPMDLSGCTIRMSLLNSTHTNAKVILLKTITETSNESTDGIIINPENGEFVITFTIGDLNDLTVGRYPFVLKVYDSVDNEILDLSSYNTDNEFNCIDIVDF